MVLVLFWISSSSFILFTLISLLKTNSPRIGFRSRPFSSFAKSGLMIGSTMMEQVMEDGVDGEWTNGWMEWMGGPNGWNNV